MNEFGREPHTIKRNGLEETYVRPDHSSNSIPQIHNTDKNQVPFGVVDVEIENTERNISNVNETEIGIWQNPLKNIINFWNHPAGPMTIFFWAPALKWALVIAGLSDLQRPAENLSILQTLALAATGTIWCRYSLVIIPKNYSLFSVNLFIGASQCYQLFRYVRYHYFAEKT